MGPGMFDDLGKFLKWVFWFGIVVALIIGALIGKFAF